MIEKMKVVHIVAAASEKTALLDRLRALGIVHFGEKASADQRHLERFAELSKMEMLLQEYTGQEPEKKLLSDKEFEVFYKDLAACIDRHKALQEQKTAVHAAAERLSEWGAFSPAELRSLGDQGLDIHIYRTDKKTAAALAADPDVRVIRLAPVGKMPTLASIGPLPAPYPVTEFPIPEKGLEELNQEWEDCDRGIRVCEAELHDAARHLPSIHDQMLKTQNAAEYSAVSNTSQSQDGLVWLTGYIPAAEVEGFKKAAAQAHWAWAMEDPAADDDKVDIFLSETDYVFKYTDADADVAMPLTDLGIDPDTDLADQYPFTKTTASDQNGVQRGSTWQCCPGLLVYRRDIAKDVFGTDDPAAVGEKVKDWDTLKATAAELRAKHWKLQQAAGIDLIPSNDFSYYDQMLDTAILLNVIPQRYARLSFDNQEDTLFAMARGYQGDKGDVTALPMKKWFTTNYHYLVPEVESAAEIKLNSTKPFDEFNEAKALGIDTKPVFIGPYTFLKLARTPEATELELDKGLVNAVAAVSTMLNGEYGIDDVCLSLPVLIADGEIRGRILPRLTDAEMEKLHASANALKNVINTLTI